MKLGVSSAFQNGILINDVLIMMILMLVVMFVMLFTMRLMIVVVILTSACS